jgi:maltooligosyltrehalose trehalohydrolase
MTSRYLHETPFGAQLLDGNRTRFRLWAPDLERVTLEVDGQSIAMDRDRDGVHTCTVDVGAGATYQYRVSEDLAVPDPASRRQQEDVHGPSVVVDPLAYRWQNTAWRGRPWREMVVYEMHAGCYGGFAAMEQELPRLADMGITAIELMPIADFSGKRNWGYDGVLPYAPDTAYGSPEALKHLVDTAHGLGLCVYLDVVYNHFGPEGNYLHTYASKFFSEENPSPWGPSIDFGQPQVREFFSHNALYWLMEYRFDGLRFDAVHAILDQDWLDEMAGQIRSACEQDRHVHLMLENERNTSAHLEKDYDAQWNDDIHNITHVLLTGEYEGYYGNYQGDEAERLARALAEGFVYQGEPAPSRDNRPRGTPSGHLPPHKFVFFLQNHDQIGNRALGERLTALVAPEALRAAIAMQLLCPQIPLLFMGEERGLKTPFLFFTDFHGELAEAVRKGRRAEFRAFSHFSDPEAQAKIPDPNAKETFDRSADQLRTGGRELGGEERETERFYRDLLNLRKAKVAPYLDGCRSIGSSTWSDACVSASWQLDNEQVLHMTVNLGSDDTTVDAPQGEVIFESKPGAAEAAKAGHALGYATSAFIE